MMENALHKREGHGGSGADGPPGPSYDSSSRQIAPQAGPQWGQPQESFGGQEHAAYNGSQHPFKRPVIGDIHSGLDSSFGPGATGHRAETKGQLRRRVVPDSGDDRDDDDSLEPLAILKRLDAFPKVKDEDFFKRTATGGIITVTALTIMSLLFLGELRSLVSIERNNQLIVDTERATDLDITFDVTLPRMPCSWVTVDVMDSTGDVHVETDDEVTKYRLDAKGNTIEVWGTKAQVGEKAGVDLADGAAKAPDPRSRPSGGPTPVPTGADGKPICGSCYEAKPDGCCNTCADVLNAFYAMGSFAVNRRRFEQCIDPAYEAAVKLQRGEGCRLVGKLTTARVGGNLHIAPGRSNHAYGGHSHDLYPFPPDAVFDFSHSIAKVRFGDELPDVTHPMDGLKHDTRKEGGQYPVQYQYFVKVVPTTYTSISGKTIASNQISVTEHRRGRFEIDRDFGSIGRLPGLFFFYEMSPIKVVLTERRMSFLSFLTSVCAIVGGVFTVSGLIESTVHKARTILGKKVELGKAI